MLEVLFLQQLGFWFLLLELRSSARHGLSKYPSAVVAYRYDTLDLITERSLSTWAAWIGYANLSLAIRSELSALIFAKATRRKDVKKKQQAEKAHKVEGLDDSPILPNGAAIQTSNFGQNDCITESVDDFEETRQSTINLVVRLSICSGQRQILTYS